VLGIKPPDYPHLFRQIPLRTLKRWPLQFHKVFNLNLAPYTTLHGQVRSHHVHADVPTGPVGISFPIVVFRWQPLSYWNPLLAVYEQRPERSIFTKPKQFICLHLHHTISSIQEPETQDPHHPSDDRYQDCNYDKEYL